MTFYMEVEEMPPLKASSLKRGKDKEDDLKYVKKRRELVRVGWRKLW